MKKEIIFAATLVLVGCSDPAKQLVTRVEVLPEASHNRLAIVSASPNPNLAPGKLLVLDLKEGKVQEAPTRIGNDPLLKRFEQTQELALVNRSNSTILFMDEKTLALKRELRPLPKVDYTNFTDLVELPSGEMYAASYESPWLYRLRVSDGIQVKSPGAKQAGVRLHNFADDDNIPEAHKMIKVGDRVFLSIQRLDRNKGFEPTQFSSLLEIDSVKDEVIAEHRMIEGDRATCLNPTTSLRALEDRRIVVGCSGSYNDAEHGGAVGVIDPTRENDVYRGILWDHQGLKGKPNELIAVGNAVFAVVLGIGNLSSVSELVKDGEPRVLARDKYVEGYRAMVYDEVRNLIWMGKVTDKGGEVIAMHPVTQQVIRRINTEYDPVQLEWLD